MYSSELVQKLAQQFPDAVTVPVPEKFIRDPEAQLRVPPARLVEVCKFLKQSPEFAMDFPLQMTAVDFIKDGIFELVYHLYSSKKKLAIVIKSQIPRTSPEIDSVTPVWSGMDWQEREVYDLMGIKFTGHPNMSRLFMWEGFGFPLRKDYVHITDKYDSGLEVGTPGLNDKGLPVTVEAAAIAGVKIAVAAPAAPKPAAAPAAPAAPPSPAPVKPVSPTPTPNVPPAAAKPAPAPVSPPKPDAPKA
jgi:NADH-quinone oxidoreductase subunit C